MRQEELQAPSYCNRGVTVAFGFRKFFDRDMPSVG